VSLFELVFVIAPTGYLAVSSSFMVNGLRQTSKSSGKLRPKWTPLLPDMRVKALRSLSRIYWETVMNRCRPAGDRKPCIARSRRRRGRWEFSARLFEALVRAMLDRGHDLAPGGGIWAELIGNHALGRAALPLEKTRQQALCWLVSRLDDFIVRTDRPPTTTNAVCRRWRRHLVEAPDIAPAHFLALQAAA
jgi:hypothetical protein